MWSVFLLFIASPVTTNAHSLLPGFEKPSKHVARVFDQAAGLMTMFLCLGTKMFPQFGHEKTQAPAWTS